MVMTAMKPVNNLMSDDLFDNSAGYDDETGVQLADGLTDSERQQAVSLYRLFNELWGLCIVVGDPGTGKDLFGNYISYKVKKFFPWKRILRDERPRPLFGPYAGLFNEDVIQKDLAKMRAIAKGESIVNIDNVMEKAADSWVQGAGEVLLKGSLLYLTEYWRYCYRREPHNPMNKTMGAIHKVKRHLDNLCIGTVQLVEDLDRKTSLPWVDWKVTCTHSVSNPTGFAYYVQKVKYDKRLDVLVPLGSPYPIMFDAGKPRSDLGDGKITIIKPKYRPMSDDEQVVLDAIRAGLDTYEEIVDFLETEGDLAEADVLRTLKELKFRKSKRVIDFACFFGLYNSKSAPNIKSALRVQE
jgi:hypothetical protein